MFPATTYANLLFFPIYIKVSSNNFLLLEANPVFVFFIIVWVGLQLLVLKIQEKRPSFFLPVFIRERLAEPVYKYEVKFEDAALESTGTYNSNTSFLLNVNDKSLRKSLK